MEINEFAQKMKRAMTEVLGDGYEVRLQEVQKNNGVLLQGMIILAKEQNVSPTIYLNPFWEAYEGGVTLGELTRRILQIYREDTPKGNIDMSFFRKFEFVKDRICYRLIHAKQNAELLEKIPHIRFLDLAICFYYAYESEELGRGTILIHNTHLNLWQTTPAELMCLAQSNTPEIFPWECNSMETVVKQLLKEEEEATGRKLLEEEEEEQFLADMPMLILSNNRKIYGAACILYPNLLAELAEKFKSNFYILPSSVHEVILLLDHGKDRPEQLRAMITEVNCTQVEPEEVLSNSLYYYESQEKKVKII